jgi:hypothetical protein
MTMGRGRRWLRIWPALTVVIATIAGPGGAAWADHTTYTVPERKLGWSACLWPMGKVITVSVDPAFPFPDSSFSDRLDEAVRRWDGVLATSGRGGGMMRIPGPEGDIVVQYRPLAGADTAEVLGEVYLRREGDADYSTNIGRCPDRRAPEYAMKAAQIRIAPRNDWFTQPDSAVGSWQMCVNTAFRMTNPGLCSAQVDFGGTIIHELGHTLVFYHPETLDYLDGTPPERSDSASQEARCVEVTNSFDAQATMCEASGQWRAEQRTLETWDIETTHRHYSR